MNYEFDKKEQATKLEQEKKDVIATEEKQKQKIIIVSVSSGLILVFNLALVILRSLRQNQKDSAGRMDWNDRRKFQGEMIINIKFTALY